MEADLREADLNGADLNGADLSRARFGRTVLGDVSRLHHLHPVGARRGKVTVGIFICIFPPKF